MTKPSDYLAVLFALSDERAYCKAHGKKEEDSAVIQACMAYLRLNKPPLFTVHLDKSLPTAD